MKNSINKNIIIAILIFFISGIVLFLVQKNVYQEMENLTIKRTNDSINESLNEFSDSLNELASSYNKDLKGRVKTVALMLQNGYDDEILKKASDLCKANYLFIEDNDGTIIYAAQKEIKGKLAKDVLDEFIDELDNETEDYASSKIFDGRTLWLCDHTSALLEANTDTKDYLLLGEDLNAFDAASAKIIIWTIILLGIVIIIIFNYGEHLREHNLIGKLFEKKCWQVAIFCLIFIGVASFYTQTLECISSAIDTADNTGKVLTQIRAQHIVDTDNLDDYYEMHDKRRISLIAACVERNIEKIKVGIENVYKEDSINPGSTNETEKIEVISFSENPFLKELMEVNNLNEIFLTDENGFTISSGTEKWYYNIKDVPEFVNVLDGKIPFYNDEHVDEGYRRNAVKCENGILVVNRPWISEDKNIRMRKEFIYDAAESYMNAHLIQTKEVEEQEQSTNSFVYKDNIKYFRHRINARSLKEENYLVAYYPVNFLFKTRTVMILWTMGVSFFAVAFLIFCQSKTEKEEDGETKKNKMKMETVVTICSLMVFILILAYALQGYIGGKSIAAIKYIENGDWQRGFNFFSLSNCIGNILGAFILQQLLSNFFKIISVDFEKYQKERFDFVALIISIVIFVVTLFMCLYNIGFNLNEMFASAGIISAVVGIACQSIIGNYFFGIKNIFDDSFRVGEWVLFNDFRGVITDMTVTDLRIMDTGGNIMKVNHQDFINAVNLSRNSSIVRVTIPIAFDESVDLIENILKKPNLTLSSELKDLIIGEPILRGVISTDGDGKDIVFEIKAKEENIDTVRYLFTLQVIDLLNKVGIQTPTPNLKLIN